MNQVYPHIIYFIKALKQCGKICFLIPVLCWKWRQKGRLWLSLLQIPVTTQYYCICDYLCYSLHQPSFSFIQNSIFEWGLFSNSVQQSYNNQNNNQPREQLRHKTIPWQKYSVTIIHCAAFNCVQSVLTELHVVLGKSMYTSWFSSL